MHSLTYNNVAFHELGRLVIHPPATRYEPAAAPQRMIKTLTVQIHAFEGSWEDNYDLLYQCAEALKTQHATLIWADEQDVTVLDRPVRVTAHDFPSPGEDALESQRHQQLTVTFEWIDHEITANALTGSYTKSGGSAVSLGQVEDFRTGYRSTRISPHRDARTDGPGRVAASGVLSTPTTADIATQRTALQAAAAALRSAIVEKSSGTLTYGSFTKVVRVESFEAQIDQANGLVRWSLSASYSEFPNEAGYTLADYRLTTRNDDETGQVRVRFAGRLEAASLAAATTALATLRTANVPAGYTRLNSESDPHYYQGDTDGTAFVELSWNEEYQQHSGNVLDHQLRVEESDALADGLINTVFSGSVRASSTASADAALATATAQAETLGKNKESTLGPAIALDERITEITRQKLSNGDWIVDVEFSYSYRRKGTKIYLEYTVETATPSFDAHTQTVSGYVVAADHATAQAQYQALVRANYNSSVLLDESVGKASEQRATITAGTLQTRLNFNFRIHVVRSASLQRGVQYSLATAQDLVTRKQTTTVTGTVTDTTRAAAESYVNSTLLPALGISGNATRLTLEEDSAKAPNVAGAATASAFFRLRFTAEYEAKLSGDIGILQCELEVETQHTGTRWVVHAIPAGESVLQSAGVEHGQRVVRGSVTATNAADAKAWADLQREAFITGSYELPPRITRRYDFPVRVEGDVDAGNFNAVHFQFQFAEWLTNEAYA